MTIETEDRWPERALYLADQKAWCKANDADVRVIAQAIGKKPNTIYGWTRPNTWVTVEDRKALADLFGVPHSRYLGNLTPPPGLSEAEWGLMSASDRSRLTGFNKAFIKVPLADRHDAMERCLAVLRSVTRIPLESTPDLPGGTLGEKIRLAREAQGVSIARVVLHLQSRSPIYEIDERRMRRIEEDKEIPEQALLSHLAETYGVPPHKLRAPARDTARTSPQHRK